MTWRITVYKKTEDSLSGILRYFFALISNEYINHNPKKNRLFLKINCRQIYAAICAAISFSLPALI